MSPSAAAGAAPKPATAPSAPAGKAPHAPSHPAKGAETVTVKTRTLDDIYREEGLEGRTVSLLKIDIEGGEHGAFLGAQNMLKHCAVIASEVSPKFLKRAGLSLDDHTALVCDQGFEMFEICDDQTIKPCTVDDLRDSRGTVPGTETTCSLREQVVSVPGTVPR